MSSIAKGTVASKAPVLTKVLSVAALTAIGVGAAEIQAPAAAQDDGSSAAGAIEEVTVSARRRDEAAQDVPIPVSVVSGQLITDVGAFNVNRIKELVPTVQLYSSNPRNTAVNSAASARRSGSRTTASSAASDFTSTASTTRGPPRDSRLHRCRPDRGAAWAAGHAVRQEHHRRRDHRNDSQATFTPDATFELGYGNDDFVQAKGSFSGPLGEKLAGRISLSSTQRDGNVYNVRTNEWINTLDNQGVRAQLLFTPNDKIDVTASIDYTTQDPNGYGRCSPALRRPCVPDTGSSRRSWRISATRR